MTFVAQPQAVDPVEIIGALQTITRAASAALVLSSQVPVDASPISQLATAVTLQDVQRSFDLIQPPIPAAVRVFSFQNFH